MKRKYIAAIISIITLVLSIDAEADLTLLGQGTSAYGTYNLIYDTDLDITWYDYTSEGNSWQNQMAWADSLTLTFESKTFSDWRLPTTVDGPFVGGYDGTTTAGYNITSSEMGHLFYTELGNTGYYDTSGNPTGCTYCLTYTGDFQHLEMNRHWSGTEYAVDSSYAWQFGFGNGQQHISEGAYLYLHAIAVCDGDMTVVPNQLALFFLLQVESFY